MTGTTAISDRSRDVFDRLLGRKGDTARLDPAIGAVMKFLPRRFEDALRAFGADATISLENHERTSAVAAMAKHRQGALCVVFGARANNPAAFLICDYPAVNLIAEMMLGGDPEFATLTAGRKPSAMERALFQQFAEMARQALQTTLATAETTACLRLADSPDQIRNGEEDTPVISFRTTLGFGDARPAIDLAVTEAALLQMARPVHETMRQPARHTGATNRSALAVRVPVTGSVMLTPITLGELAGLRPGDVLPFPEDQEGRVKLKAKGHPLYDCGIGRKGHNYALCLQRPHKAMTEALSSLGVAVHPEEIEEPHDE